MMQPTFIQRVVRKLDKTLASLFFIDQWVIMTARDPDYARLQWAGLRPLMPELDRYWGDPFVIRRESRYYVFVEEKVYAAGLGHISCLTLDDSGRLLSNQIVLQRPYHLSYPFLFEHGGRLMMMPETAGNQTVEVYRCVHFPDQWEFVKTLMSGIYAVDASLLEHRQKFWLFVNIKERGSSSLNSLHLFFADDPLDDRWRPHPRNPIVRDIRSARPAGCIFTRDGQLIRPSQDSSRRYGGALKFNRITRLDEEEYQETTVSTFEPPGGKIRATHTFNQVEGLMVIDAVIRRRK